MRRRSPLFVVLAFTALVVAGCGVGAAPSAGGPPPNGSTRSPAPGSSAFLTASGTQLVLNGHPYRTVSVDAYQIATDGGLNAGCAGTVTDPALDAFFASLPAGATVRIWGFQGAMATNPTTRLRDWTGLDRVVSAAGRHGDHLVVSLGNQDGDCDDGHWKDAAWYQGGYRTSYPGNGYTIATVSYLDWVHEIVGRYKDSPTVAMWELINEPEASSCAAGYGSVSCYQHLGCADQAAAAAALRSFFDVVGGEVKRIDVNHLVESGTIGGTQCGIAGTGFATVHASPGVDVASFHDYSPAQAVPAELAARLTEAHQLGKPLIVGELGAAAGQGIPGCLSFTDRQAQYVAAINAQLAAGVPMILFWDWVPDPRPPTCTFDIGTGDPVLGLLSSS